MYITISTFKKALINFSAVNDLIINAI